MFSRGTFDMGRTTLVEHSIDTGQNRPIRQALRRHPRAHLDEIDRQVDELQDSGFVEPAKITWFILVLHYIRGPVEYLNKPSDFCCFRCVMNNGPEQ